VFRKGGTESAARPVNARRKSAEGVVGSGKARLVRHSKAEEAEITDRPGRKIRW